MPLKPINKDRYPGLVPFDKGQSTIFFGREQEKKELFYQLSLEKTVLLFGKSGLGKSSLLNAGVSPLLEKAGYLPVRVRFTNGSQSSDAEGSENLLLRDFIQSFRGNEHAEKILFNKDKPQLWEYVKAANYNELAAGTAGSGMPVVPIFILDQFEEFFSHPVKHQQEFLAQFAEIVHNETPYRILDWITGIEPEERTPEQLSWYQQPNIKIIFVLRSDRLANMQSIVSFIPTVMRNRYELKALTPVQASEAIKGPAEKADLGPEYILPFTFDETMLQEIVHELSGSTDEIESSQLQIVSNYIEQQVQEKFGERKEFQSRVVDKTIIDPEKDFPVILENFYETQLAKIKNPGDRELARRLIEDNLVVENQRDSISKNKLNAEHGISDELIEEILRTRLIREESTSRGIIYELSHDTLIAPVVKSKKQREEKEEKRLQEEERLALAEAARKKDEELKEKYEQLARETKLREEAELKNAEIIRLNGKVKTRGRLIFAFVVVAAAGMLYLQWDSARRDNRKAKKELSEANSYIAADKINIAKDILKDSMLLNSTDSSRNKDIKASILVLLNDADSLADKTNNKREDTAINRLVESVFKEDFKELDQIKTGNPKKYTTAKERLDAIKELPKYKDKYEQMKVDPDFKVNRRLFKKGS